MGKKRKCFSFEVEIQPFFRQLLKIAEEQLWEVFYQHLNNKIRSFVELADKDIKILFAKHKNNCLLWLSRS